MLEKIAFSCFALAISIAMLTGCAGKDGVAGPAGADANGTCTQCHNHNTLIAAKQNQWELSAHNQGTAFEEERKRQSCARCHNGQGYVSFVTGETLFQTYSTTKYPSDTLVNADSAKLVITADSVMNGTKVNCYTCHKIHSTYSESDYTLTNINPVKIFYDSSKTMDFGKGNLCASCHQGRSTPPALTGTVNVTNRFGQHHGPQANMLQGINGWEGGDVSVIKESSSHKTVVKDGCVQCHASQENGKDHTWEPVIKTCNSATCHANTFKSLDVRMTGKTQVDSVQTKMSALIAQVRDTLIGRNIIKLDATVAIGIAMVPGSGGTSFSAEVAGLCYNYLMVVEDGSRGFIIASMPTICYEVDY